MDTLIWLAPLFFATAIVYSMAGFGGGSTYLALLALFGVPYLAVPKIALLCNLVVVSAGFLIFHRAGHFSWRKTLPFVVASIPASYLCGRIPIGERTFLVLVALSLLIAAGRMLFSESSRPPREPPTAKAWLFGLPLGALLGGLAGLIGIGGGIFLAPILFLLGWSHARQIAASAAFFILVNSIAGLAGQISKGWQPVEILFLLPLAAAVAVGGQIGSRLGAGYFRPIILQRLTAILLVSVSVRVFWRLAAGGVP